MGLNNSIKNGQRAVASTAIAGASGTTIGLPSVSMVRENVETGTLACTATIGVTTNTLTVSGRWQVSLDDSTYVDCAGSNNAAAVTIVTGSGVLQTVTKSYEAPAGVYGYPYARFAILTGVTAGGAGDTYLGSYSYRNKARQ